MSLLTEDRFAGRLAVTVHELGELLGIGTYVAYQVAGRIGVRVGRGKRGTIVVPIERVKALLSGELQPDSPPPSSTAPATST